ncbi:MULTISPECIES: AAA family ATPase [Bradyrhizobium]|uniref:AAA family ATPase n=1 Tax=Bradyrhizobium elkanii TaxID=29448 RepID=UPI0003F55240|nr:AAA family ATPase [Bradyrhizobium elkanii]
MMHGKPDRPVTLQGDLRNLPPALDPLKALPNWVCWRWEWRVDKRGIGKWTKPPLQPKNPTSYARNNDPTTWGTYEQALAAFEADKCDGIGFNLSGTDIAAFDLDNTRHPATGDIVAEAMAYVDRATSYTEISVSGTGLHVIGFGCGGAKMHRKQKIPGSSVEVESYRGAERYIVVTGNPLPGIVDKWPHLVDIGDEIDAVVAELDGCQNARASRADELDPEQQAEQDKQAELDDEFAYKPNAGNQNTGDGFGDAGLPDELIELIENGVPPQKDLSAAFHRAVCCLADCGWSAERIERRIAGKPIVPGRYGNRLAQEIARCLHKRKIKAETGTGGASGSAGTAGAQQSPPLFELFWHGKTYDRELRSWLVKDLIFENGTGLASGQWGTAKTFAVLDLAASVMTATPFAGREVIRRGGVVFVAAEGAYEIPIRLEGVVEEKLRPAALASGVLGQRASANLDSLPFAWIEDCPNLQDSGDFARLVATVKQAAQNISDQFDLPLVLIIIDTLSAAGNFKDANDAAEGQRIMNRLGELGRQTGAFVLAVDHFGKAVETGTRGTSAKEAAADVILALLADREINGTISNMRLALRKLRGGKVGTETPFELRVVNMGFETTCVVEWKADRTSAQTSCAPRERWPKSLRIFKTALETTVIEHGEPMQPYGNEGPTVRVVPLDTVRFEFARAYPAEGDAKAKAAAKAKAFKRALQQARERELVCSR